MTGIVQYNGTGIQALPFSNTVQNVAYTGTAAQSAAFGAGVTIIRLCASTDCFYLIGADPTATVSNGHRLSAGDVDHQVVSAGQKISVIRASEDGSLNVGEIAIGG